MATAIAPIPRTRRGKGPVRASWWVVGAFMAPWVIGLLVFTLYPMAASLYFSFTRYDNLGSPQWVGLLNYRFMFTRDPYMKTAMANTAWMIVIAIPVKTAFAIATAALLARPRRGIRLYRTMAFLPSMWPPVAAALGFVFLMSPTGPLNQLLRGFGWSSAPNWFLDPSWSKPGLLVLAIWGIGDALIIYIAGLLDVPSQLYEAADIEGASRPQRFRYVTLPMISPVIFFSIVTGVIDAFQTFTEAYVVSGNAGGAGALGAPSRSLLFYQTWLYGQGFRYFHMGYASAMAWVMFAATMVCTLILIKSSNRWVFYQGGLR